MVDAMRRGEHQSFVEFQLRFAPLLLAEARRARVSEDARDERVTELLDDAIMRLLEPDLRMPRTMAAYLVTAFRRRLINFARGATRRARVVSEAAPAMDGYSAGNIVALASEATRLASAGPGADAMFPSPAVSRFVEILARDLTEDERRILEWSASQVPQREIAAWLGIGYEAAGRRVRRLRARLVAASRVYLAELNAHDRAVIERLIRRSDITFTFAPPRENLP
ncbi:MAG: hypothetical protein M3081_10030 [Gemmatimonadota bacterium]|nr:hypothetical protein [Gemmatimonadota bacterium]